MDRKFYVSYEAARLLKEKGYNEGCTTVYDCVFKEIIPATSVGLYRNECMRNDYYCSAPTKAEAIDWLESKGVVVLVDEYYIIHEEADYYTSCWGYYIRKNDECVCRDNSSDYKTRLEAEEAAIIKACELL